MGGETLVHTSVDMGGVRPITLEASSMEDQGVQAVAIHPNSLELPPGVTGGRLVFPGGQTVQIATDPASTYCQLDINGTINNEIWNHRAFGLFDYLFKKIDIK